MLVFLTPLVNCCLSTFSLTSPTPLPSQSKRTVQDTDSVWLCWWGVLSCVVDHILQEFNTLFLTRLRNYKIATPPQTKTQVKTIFRDWCLHITFVHGCNKEPHHTLGFLGFFPRRNGTLLRMIYILYYLGLGEIQRSLHIAQFTHGRVT